MNAKNVDILKVEEINIGYGNGLFFSFYDADNDYQCTISEDLILNYYYEIDQDEYIDSFFYKDSFGEKIFMLDQFIDEIKTQQLLDMYTFYIDNEDKITGHFKHTIL